MVRFGWMRFQRRLRLAELDGATRGGNLAELFVFILFAGELEEVGDIKESVALETDVDERGLHAGQHAGHFAPIDVSDHSAIAFARN